MCGVVSEVKCYRRGQESTVQGRQMLFRFSYTQSVYQQRDITVESMASGAGFSAFAPGSVWASYMPRCLRL